MSEKFLIVGLGNPGKDYAQTKHNAGFWVIDELAKRHNLTNFKSERKALVTDGIIKGKRVLLAKPQTFMNLSGESVRALVDFYKIELTNLIVIHDELDLPLGTLRLRQSGGHGGQNGVRNIIQHLGTQDFSRARFGIGRPNGNKQAVDHVLSRFSADEAIVVQQVIELTANAVEHWLEEGIGMAMSRYNGDVTNNGTKGNTPSPTNVKELLKLAERAHELNPKEIKPLEEMAKHLKHLRQLDEAARAHLKIAELYHEMGKPKQMLAEWEIAAKMRPMLIELREEMAKAYEANEDDKRAVLTWLSLAEYHERQNDMMAAQSALKQAARINPQHPKLIDMQIAFNKRLTM
jgi:peptidyl-tRNA hydrolase, PTH1 family